MSGPRWVSETAVLAIHGMLLSEHGGPTGVRDRGLLESALTAPRNHVRYDDPDLFVLAAVHAHAIIKNHPFVDGNKRTAFAVAGVFLELNGFRLTAGEADAVLAVLALVSGEMTMQDFADWLRMSSLPIADVEDGSRP